MSRMLGSLALCAVAASLAVIALTPTPAAATTPCPSPPCDTSKRDALEACERRADWVVEGRVAEVRQGSMPMSELGPFVIETGADGAPRAHRPVVTIQVWDGGQVLLKDIVILKGVVPASRRELLVRGAVFCWMRDAYIPDYHVDRRVRVYGTDNEMTSDVVNAQLRPGIFAAIRFDAQGEVMWDR